MAHQKRAILHRMVLPQHTCPYGVRAKELLEDGGFAVDDRILGSREEVEAFKSEHGLETTPLVVIDNEEIGGSEELEAYLAQQTAAAA